MNWSLSHQILSLLLVTSLKGTVLIGIIYVIGIFWQKLTPELKHFMWIAVILSFLIIPMIHPLISAFSISVVRIPTIEGNVYQHVSSLVTTSKLTIPSFPQPSGPAVNTTISVLTGENVFSWVDVWVYCWAAGVVLSLLPLLWGRKSLGRLINNSYQAGNTKIFNLLEQLAAHRGIKKPVGLLFSPDCTVPFTFGTIKPVIILPLSFREWSEAQLKPILIHELSHVKRLDYLTQTVARIVCALFWFLPAIWIAFNRLHLEQERACDTMVIVEGVPALEYADQMVGIVQRLKRHYRIAGLSMAKSRKTVFEKRIFHILDVGRTLSDRMKGRNRSRQIIVSIGFLFSFLLLLISTCATEIESRPVNNPLLRMDLTPPATRITFLNGHSTQLTPVSEEDFLALYTGTWVNPENEGTIFSPQFLIYNRKSCMVYGTPTEVFPLLIVHPRFSAIWRDRDGNIWFESTWNRDFMHEHYEVGKITKGGLALERFGTHEPISGWSPGDPFTQLVENNTVCYHFVIYKFHKSFNESNTTERVVPLIDI